MWIVLQKNQNLKLGPKSTNTYESNKYIFFDLFLYNLSNDLFLIYKYININNRLIYIHIQTRQEIK